MVGVAGRRHTSSVRHTKKWSVRCSTCCMVCPLLHGKVQVCSMGVMERSMEPWLHGTGTKFPWSQPLPEPNSEL